MHFIQNLKEKPSYVKSRIAFLTAVSFTGIIAFIWLSTIPARFQNMESFTPEKVDGQEATVSSALDEIISGTKEGFDSLKVEDKAPTPPPTFESNSALGDLSNWSAPATSTPEAVEILPLPSEESIITPTPIPTPTPTPTPTPIPVSVPPVVSPSIGGKETIGGTGESKASVILIGTTTKKSE